MLWTFLFVDQSQHVYFIFISHPCVEGIYKFVSIASPAFAQTGEGRSLDDPIITVSI